MTASQRTRRASRIRIARCGRIGDLGGVGAGGYCLLDLLHIRQLGLAGRGVRRVDVGRMVGKDLRSQRHAAVATQGQFAALGQVHCHRARGPGLQQLTGVHLVAFDHQTLGAVARHRENIAHHLLHSTDQPGHIHSLAANTGSEMLRIQQKLFDRRTEMA
ncbi:hypothetical protein D3M70_08140 [Pseudomonas sp. LS-2]|nr:hypothetical protein D3M70_08140 [Pseudomonas sp. LS-2]